MFSSSVNAVSGFFVLRIDDVELCLAGLVVGRGRILDAGAPNGLLMHTLLPTCRINGWHDDDTARCATLATDVADVPAVVPRVAGSILPARRTAMVLAAAVHSHLDKTCRSSAVAKSPYG